MDFEDSPKKWACNRRKLKYCKRRDCRKSSANGLSLKKTSFSDKLANCLEYDDALSSINMVDQDGESYTMDCVSHAPNPIENYFNRFRPNATDISLYLNDIVNETKPNEIIYKPMNKIVWNSNLSFDPSYCYNTIHLIYKYNNEQYYNALLWKLNYLKQQKIKDAIFNNNSNSNGTKQKQGQQQAKRKEYIAPNINEPILRVSDTKTFYKNDEFYPNNNNNKNNKLKRKIDFVLIDFGRNVWFTGFGTLYHLCFRWVYDGESGKKRNKRKEWYYICVLNDYKIEIASELDNNNSNNNNNNGKNKYKTSKNKNKNSKNKEYLGRLNVKQWELLGEYNGNLDKYYNNENYQNETRIYKKFRVLNENNNNNNIPHNQEYSKKHILQHGKLCRYVKITPIHNNNNNDNNNSNFVEKINFIAHGFDVDMFSKPIIWSKQDLLTRMQSQQMHKNKNNNNNSNNNEINILEERLRIGSSSKILENEKNNDEKSHVVQVSIINKGRKLNYSNRIYHCYYNWPNESLIQYKKQEKRYLQYIIRKTSQNSSNTAHAIANAL